MQIAIFGGSREKFTSAEIGVLRQVRPIFRLRRTTIHTADSAAMMQFIDKGGSVLIMLGEGGEAKYGTNINFLLEEYGIMINPDAVCRYSHPIATGSFRPLCHADEALLAMTSHAAQACC